MHVNLIKLAILLHLRIVLYTIICSRLSDTRLSIHSPHAYVSTHAINCPRLTVLRLNVRIPHFGGSLPLTAIPSHFILTGTQIWGWAANFGARFVRKNALITS